MLPLTSGSSIARGQRTIEDATIKLCTPDGSVVAEGTTNAQGKFTFNEVPEGTFAVEITLPTIPEPPPNKYTKSVSTAKTRPQYREIKLKAMGNGLRGRITIVSLPDTMETTIKTEAGTIVNVASREPMDLTLTCR